MRNPVWILGAALLALTACGKEPAIGPQPRVVAVATLMSHPALDEVRLGLTEGLREAGLQEGRDFRIVDRNASGQMPMAATIAADLAGQSPAVIVGITTPMAQALHAKWKGPLVFAAVTDPVGAGLVTTLDGTPNVTGTSDAWPYEAQLALIRRIQPTARTIGVVFNPAEAASQYGMIRLRKAAPANGFTIKEYAVNSTGEVASAARLAAQATDALLISSDNTVISAVGAALSAAIDARKPLYAGDSGSVEKGAVAAASVGYRRLGVDTGKLTARILNGERTIPVVISTGADIYINSKAAELVGLRLPPEVVKDAKGVFSTIKR